MELTRFATSDTEGDLIRWKGVSSVAIRHKADLAHRQSIEEVQEAERSRFLSCWHFDENRRFGLQAELPQPMGPWCRRPWSAWRRLSRLSRGKTGAFAEARRADALVSLCSARIADDAHPDRATVVVHAQLDGVVSGNGGCEVEGGPVIHPETARPASV